MRLVFLWWPRASGTQMEARPWVDKICVHHAYPPLPLYLWHALCLVCSFVAHILQPNECKLLVLDRKRIQIKKLSTKNLNNFWSSTTFILTLFSSEVVCKIWILNLTNLDTIFERRNDFKKTLSTIKFYNFQRSTTFILVVSSYEVVWKTRKIKNKNDF
jgi:hypothetical protein